MFQAAQEISTVFEIQRTFFESGYTQDIKNRKKFLEKLKTAIRAHEEHLSEALEQDFYRDSDRFIDYDFQIIYKEIDNYLQNLSKWTKSFSSYVQMSTIVESSVRSRPSPLGNVLIMAHWSSPLLYCFLPVIQAIGSGCTATVLPPKETPNSSAEIAKILTNHLQSDWIYCFFPTDIDHNLALELIVYPFDKIWAVAESSFLTEVRKRNADLLSTATFYELRRNPALVHKDADIAWAAKEIVKSKFAYAGQSLLSLDFILVHQSKYGELVKELCHQIDAQVTPRPNKNKDYCRLVLEEDFQRLKADLLQERVIYGGEFYGNERILGPTLIDNPKYTSVFVQKTTLTPVLPILKYSNFKDAMNFLQKSSKSTYFAAFTYDLSIIEHLESQLHTGSVTVNKTYELKDLSAYPISDPSNQGMIGFTGKHAFDAFSYLKTTTHKLSLISKIKNFLTK